MNYYFWLGIDGEPGAEDDGLITVIGLSLPATMIAYSQGIADARRLESNQG